ncbi:MAG: YtxH domain-containing protein [Cyclobacteriaceae bacterium]
MKVNAKAILSFTIGAAVGVAAGILTAPRSGKRTRVILGSEIDRTKTALEEAANIKLNEAKELLNSTLETQLAKGKESINKVKNMVNN